MQKQHQLDTQVNYSIVVKEEGLTAWRALVEIADVKPGQRVLINGISGAIGS